MSAPEAAPEAAMVPVVWVRVDDAHQAVAELALWRARLLEDADELVRRAYELERQAREEGESHISADTVDALAALAASARRRADLAVNAAAGLWDLIAALRSSPVSMADA